MQPPPANLPPAQCVAQMLAQAHRLGVLVRWQPASTELCTLISHEMVHVLQHWRGQLQALLPLGWPIDGAPSGRSLSRHEAEAYTAKQHPQRVLEALRQLPVASGVDPQKLSQLR